MIAKLAILFLVVMAALGLVFGRRGRKKTGGGKARKGVAEAARCPDCGAWIVAGARCPCGGKDRG
ncbi:hypothetical protein ACQ5SO_03635 [Rhodovulum sp. DZ06]|uniref:hypothetical protein n=1 Tax=Rhodovulum sp. DZ06 TaxID=3425126 RepID=UPI003D34D75C